MKGTQTIAHVSSLLILQKIITLNDGGGGLELAGGRKVESILGGFLKKLRSGIYRRGRHGGSSSSNRCCGFSSETLHSEYRVRSPSSHLVLPANSLPPPPPPPPPHPHPRGPGASSSPRPEFLPPEGLTGSP